MEYITVCMPSDRPTRMKRLTCADDGNQAKMIYFFVDAHRNQSHVNLFKISKYGKQSPFIIDTHAIFEVQFPIHTWPNEEDANTHSHITRIDSQITWNQSAFFSEAYCRYVYAAFSTMRKKNKSMESWERTDRTHQSIESRMKLFTEAAKFKIATVYFHFCMK